MAGRNLLPGVIVKPFIAMLRTSSTYPSPVVECCLLDLCEVAKALDVGSRYQNLYPDPSSFDEVTVLTHQCGKETRRKHLASGLGIPMSHIIDLEHASSFSAAFGDHLRENLTINVDEVRVDPRLQEWLTYGNPLLPLCKAYQREVKTAQRLEVIDLERENPDVSAGRPFQQTTAHIPYTLSMMGVPEGLNVGYAMMPETVRPPTPLHMRETGASDHKSGGGNALCLPPGSPVPMKSMIHHHNNTVSKYQGATTEGLPTPPSSAERKQGKDSKVAWNNYFRMDPAYGAVSRNTNQDFSFINVPDFDAMPNDYFNGSNGLSGGSGQQQQELNAQMAEHFDKIRWPPLPVDEAGMTTSMNASAFSSSIFGASSQIISHNRQSNFASAFEDGFHPYEYPEPAPQSVGPYVSMSDLEIERLRAYPYPPHFDLHAMPLPASRNGPEDYNFEPMDPSHPDHRSQRLKKAAQSEVLEAIKHDRKDNKKRARLENYRQQSRPEPIAVIDVSNPQMPSQTATATANPEAPVKRPRGRPRKYPLPLPLPSPSIPSASITGKRRGLLY